MLLRPLVFTWPYAAVFWAFYVWVFVPEFGIILRASRPAADAGSADRGSLRVVLIGMNLALVSAFLLAFVPALRLPQRFLLPAFWAGLATMISGSLLRRHCWRVLGECFTGDVRADAAQPVIDRGAYRWVRHPSYTAGILIVLGIGVALGSWGSVILPTLMTVAAYSYRIMIEERALTNALGDRYRHYARSRKRLIPFIV